MPLIDISHLIMSQAVQVHDIELCLDLWYIVKLVKNSSNVVLLILIEPQNNLSFICNVGQFKIFVDLICVLGSVCHFFILFLEFCSFCVFFLPSTHPMLGQLIKEI